MNCRPKIIVLKWSAACSDPLLHHRERLRVWRVSSIEIVSRTLSFRLPAQRIRDALDDISCKQPVSVFRSLTMIAHPSELTYTLQFLRSFMQWLGGVGVIVLMISIIARPGTCMYALYHAECRDEKTTPGS